MRATARLRGEPTPARPGDRRNSPDHPRKKEPTMTLTLLRLNLANAAVPVMLALLPLVVMLGALPL